MNLSTLNDRSLLSRKSLRRITARAVFALEKRASRR
jgi:hypothetical protein